MRIGIIGAGHMGATLAEKFNAVGHEVAVANSRGPDTLQELDRALGDHGHAVTAEDAARFGEVVVVAVPFGRYREVPTTMAPNAVVIDTSNYYPQRDGHFPELDEDRTTSSELLHQHLGDVRLVKAFNAIRWDHLRDYGRQNGFRIGIPISGDDEQAKRVVSVLIDQLGFEAVDAGDLAHGGRKHQPGTSVYVADLPTEELRAKLNGGRGKGELDSRHDWADEAVKARTSDDPRARTPHDTTGTPSTGYGQPPD
jgi:predicted dinucleotide-binding enzyme